MEPAYVEETGAGEHPTSYTVVDTVDQNTISRRRSNFGSLSDRCGSDRVF
jgi:hypothetical protein